MRPNHSLLLKPVVVLAAFVAGAATSGCSKGELSAAERDRDSVATSSVSAVNAADADSTLGRQTLVPADTWAIPSVASTPTQSLAPASIEDILKRSPLKDLKADCATPDTTIATGTQVGTQCPTDPPPKK